MGVVSFPFSAIVGQEALKQALILAAIDPALGGVLALGDRGTGKSTTIRALAALLPEVPVTDDPRLDPNPPEGATTKSAPVVDLPLGATEDRIVGALDLEAALVRGEKKFQPGLLAAAHQGFLYIDEVNLLEDHLVDVLLDVAASGENVIEREGLSVRHPARFVLVGSGNPEEGDLRPQLIDRFGLAVEVRTLTDIQQRLDVIKRREAFDTDPQAFCDQWQTADLELRDQIVAARKRLASLTMPDDVLERAAGLCIALGTDGLRGELTLSRACQALAAYNGDEAVTAEHLQAIAIPSLRHRLRKNPLDDTDAAVRVERAVDEVLG
ncbi:MAG: ATP-binding protein [Parvularculaceae bacterium]|nr:ATP-binding protein [Parvularculaceae bacterium]